MVFCVSLTPALVLSSIFLIPYYSHVASPDDYFNIIEVCHLALHYDTRYFTLDITLELEYKPQSIRCVMRGWRLTT
jgi:hypothetical protein